MDLVGGNQTFDYTMVATEAQTYTLTFDVHGMDGEVDVSDGSFSQDVEVGDHALITSITDNATGNDTTSMAAKHDLTITGSGFTGVTKVFFARPGGGSVFEGVPVTPDSDTQITFPAPDMGTYADEVASDGRLHTEVTVGVPDDAQPEGFLESNSVPFDFSHPWCRRCRVLRVRCRGRSWVGMT